MLCERVVHGAYTIAQEKSRDDDKKKIITCRPVSLL